MNNKGAFVVRTPTKTGFLKSRAMYKFTLYYYSRFEIKFKLFGICSIINRNNLICVFFKLHISGYMYFNSAAEDF